MQADTLLSLPPGVTITDYVVSMGTLYLLLTSTSSSASCPVCLTPSSAQHSSYQRTARDVPSGDYALRIQLRTRRFFCRQPDCTRRIFTERFASFLLPRARMTERFRATLLALSATTAHEAAQRLACLLHLPTSVTTLRRQLGRQQPPVLAEPTKIGMDDFAFRKGKTYGTIIVDLESHHVVDLLEDRSSATVETWLRAHPHLCVISRDRAGEYAQAADRAAPQARQIADRFHLLMNAGECLERFIQRHPTLLHEATASTTLPRSARRCAADRSAKDERAQRRAERYRQVQHYTRQGKSQPEIARLLGIARGTVIRYQRADAVPGSAPRERPREIDRYVPYLRERWEAGEHNVRMLWEAIRAQGFGGSFHYLGRYLTQWRTESGRKGRPSSHPVLTPTVLPQRQRSVSARRLRWWCCKGASDLTTEQRALLDELYQRCPDLLTMQQHLTQFMQMVRHRERSSLEPWLHNAEQTHLPDLVGFVQGIRRDFAAVAAALEYGFSQGVVEGQINRLKTIKRQLYGRASLRVLKQHVLLSAA
ncbi:MAG: ISL3 family transposase [Ktedonobacterales bacterium]